MLDDNSKTRSFRGAIKIASPFSVLDAKIKKL